MALMYCEWCGRGVTKHPARVNHTKNKRVCCRDPVCFKKYMREVALKARKERRDWEVAR